MSTALEMEKAKIVRRRQLLLDYCPDVKARQGIEIGPMCYPTLTKDESDVLYLDIKSKEAICADIGTCYPEPIVDIDIVTGSASLATTLAGRRFDYFIANHVVEHVPDFISWFEELHSLLKPGGFVYLAVPDRRFTFDRDRQETTCGHFIVDYETGSPVDAAEHLLDALIYHEQKPDIFWRDIASERYSFIHHHHVFNRENILDKVLRPLIRLRYLPFSIMEIATAPELFNEFVLILRAEACFEDITVLGEPAELQAKPTHTGSGADPDLEELRIAERIRRSGLFNAAWYRQQYPEAAASGLDPIRHYLTEGCALGYNPSPHFDSSWYLAQNPDVTAAGYNPLWHFAVCGQGEGRRGRPE